MLQIMSQSVWCLAASLWRKPEAPENLKHWRCVEGQQGPPKTVRSTVSNHQTDPRSIHILVGFVTSFWAILGSARLGVMFTVVGPGLTTPLYFKPPI
jgi:hypothetical protein